MTLLVHDVEASCGPGLLTDPTAEADGWRIVMDSEILSGLLGFSLPASARVVRARGDSMLPFIRDGQWCIYDPVQNIVSGHRYVFQLEELDTDDWMLYIKRLQRLAGGGVKIISDNLLGGIDDEMLVPVKGDRSRMRNPVNDAEVRLHVAGRVLWPSEDEHSRDSFIINQAIDRLVARGAIKPGT